MADKLVRLRTIFIAPELSYGVDPTITGNDWVASEELTVVDEQDTVQTNVARPYFGGSAEIPVNFRRRATFLTRLGLTGGAAGTAPAIAELLKGCALGEVINAGTDVVYTPYTDAPTSVWGEPYFDGNRRPMPGARGSFTLTAAINDLLRYDWDFLSIIRDPDLTAAPPTAVATPWTPEIPVTAANTQAFNIGGQNFALLNYVLNSGNVVNKSSAAGDPAVGGESVVMAERDASLSVTIKSVDVTDKDWRGIIESQTLEAVNFAHGINAGQITTVACPSCQLVSKSDGDDGNGVETLTLTYKVLPVNGNDEFTITIS